MNQRTFLPEQVAANQHCQSWREKLDYVRRLLINDSTPLTLEALVACAGVTMGAVSTALGINLKLGVVTAEGDIDFRGTLGVSKDVPVGFEKIRLRFLLDAAASEDQIQTLIRLTERYCVVFQTLSNGASVDVSYQTLTD